MRMVIKTTLAALSLALLAGQTFASPLVEAPSEKDGFIEEGIRIGTVSEVNKGRTRNSTHSAVLLTAGNAVNFNIKSLPLTNEVAAIHNSDDKTAIVFYNVHTAAGDMLNGLKASYLSFKDYFFGLSEEEKKASSEYEDCSIIPTFAPGFFVASNPLLGNNTELKGTVSVTPFAESPSSARFKKSPVQDSTVNAEKAYLFAGNVVAVRRYAGSTFLPERVSNYLGQRFNNSAFDLFSKKVHDRSCLVTVSNSEMSMEFITVTEEICQYAYDSAVGKQPVTVMYDPNGLEDNIPTSIMRIQPQSTPLDAEALDENGHPAGRDITYEESADRSTLELIGQVTNTILEKATTPVRTFVRTLSEPAIKLAYTGTSIVNETASALTSVSQAVFESTKSAIGFNGDGDDQEEEERIADEKAKAQRIADEKAKAQRIADEKAKKANQQKKKRAVFIKYAGK